MFFLFLYQFLIAYTQTRTHKEMNSVPNNSHNSIRREQMSISSITSNQTRHLPLFSSQPPPLYRHINQYPGSSNIIKSPPTSPINDQFIHSPPSSPHSFDFSPSSSSQHNYQEEDNNNNSNNSNINSNGNILQERRQRNKAASAKYRQKKNIQHYEMRSMINQISERNAILERQLREVREENQKLRAINDKLRGKYVAKKLLGQWMERQKQQRLPLPIPTFPDDPPNSLITGLLDISNSECMEIEDDNCSLDSLCSEV